jgi:hypothetical protein
MPVEPEELKKALAKRGVLNAEMDHHLADSAQREVAREPAQLYRLGHTSMAPTVISWQLP